MNLFDIEWFMSFVFSYLDIENFLRLKLIFISGFLVCSRYREQLRYFVTFFSYDSNRIEQVDR